MTSGVRVRRRVFVASVGAALLLVGCGGDDDGGVSGGGDRDDDVSTANDQEIADGAITDLERTLRDEGFAVAADDDDEEDDDLEFESEDCQEFEKAFPASDDFPGETASAESDDFERGELAPTTGGVLESVSGTVDFVEDADDVDALIRLLDTDRARGCIEEVLRIGLESAAAENQQAVELEVEVEQLDSQRRGDTRAGFEAIGEFTTSGITVPFSFAIEVVRVERAVIGITASELGADEPTIDRAALLNVLVDAVGDQST